MRNDRKKIQKTHRDMKESRVESMLYIKVPEAGEGGDAGDTVEGIWQSVVVCVEHAGEFGDRQGKASSVTHHGGNI